MYKRVSNIDEKIHDVKLTYDAWKTLFLLSEETDVAEIAAILQEDADSIRTHLDVLLKAELIDEIPDEQATPEEEHEPAPEEAKSEEKPDIEETAEEEPVLEEVEDDTPETEAVSEETVLEEESVTEEAPEETILEEEPVAEETAEETILEEEPTELPPVEDLSDLMGELSEPEPETEEPPLQEAAAEETESLELDVVEEEPEAVEEEKQEEEPTAAPIPEMAEEAPKPTGTPIVLVIDDSIVIRKMVEIALENEDWLVETAVSGKDGMDKIDSINPSLIILDLMLPDINGIDILKTVKASRKIPVIMLSGKDSPQMVENAKNAGADAFLPKPFKDDELKEQIKTLLEA